jgi:hypothetical protein
MQDVMNEISRRWHQRRTQQDSDLPAPVGPQEPISTSTSSQPHRDIGHFFTAPPPVQESSTVSLSEIHTIGQQLPASKSESDSGYVTANHSMYGQIPELSAYGSLSGRSLRASQGYQFAPPGSSAFSPTSLISSGADQLGSDFEQFDFDTPRNLTMEHSTQLRVPHSSLGVIEQPGLGSMETDSQWRPQGGFGSSFQAVTGGTQETVDLSDLFMNLNDDQLGLSGGPGLGEGN